MAEVTTYKFEKLQYADTASGQSTLIDWQMPFPGNMEWMTGTTMSNAPIWTSRIDVEQQVQTASTKLLKEVSSGDHTVVFDKGLRLAVTVELDGDLYIASDERFGLYGSGPSEEEALSDYGVFFVEFFSEITRTPNAELPPSAKSLKRTLKAFGKLEHSG